MLYVLIMEKDKNSYLIPNKILYGFKRITLASNNDAFLLLRRKYLFGEEGVKLIWIPSIFAVFKNSFWHYAQTCGFLIFIFFLEIEKLTPYPRSSFPPITVSTVKTIECHTIKQYQIKCHSIRQYHCIRIWYYCIESDTVLESDTWHSIWYYCIRFWYRDKKKYCDTIA